MQTNDFKGQDLRGRLFKNQDLTGADFSDCDLRKADFTGCTLCNVKFLGCDLRKTSFARMNLTDVDFSGSDLRRVDFSRAKLGRVTFCKATLDKTVDLALALIVAVLIVVVVGKDLTETLVVVKALALILAVVGTFAKAEAAVGFFALALTLTGALALTVALRHFSFDEVIIEGILAFYFILASMLYVWGALQEHIALSGLRNLLLTLLCSENSSQFRWTTLKNCYFNELDLKWLNFSQTMLHGCSFNNSKNHHLAWFKNTPLEPRKVRDLVIDGIITDKNFATLDLRGLDFSNLNLQDFDFSHANLSGANLSHTQLTGATLEGWNIDTETNLKDVDCRYYHYFAKVKKDDGSEEIEKRRMPEKEDYKEGEFSRIFQKIANTIDFIAHNEMELAAIKLSVEQVQAKQGNEEVRIQGIEEKNGVIVVKVAVPKFKDRGVLYDQISKLKNKIQLLTVQHKEKVLGYETRITDLKEQLDKNRNAVTVTIKDSIIDNTGVINFGEMNGNVSQ